MSNDGYVFVASINQAFYRAAVNSAVSLLDHNPSAKITLFTHEAFFRKEDGAFFDRVVTGIPVDVRAKMWGMARSPYDRTLYMDCDTEVRSERISEVFDILDGNDVMFTRIIPHVSKERRIDDQNELTYHGGVVLYNSKDLTLELMNDWFELYKYQKTTRWSESKFRSFDPAMRQWDQFTVWYLLHREPKFKDLRHSLFPGGGTEFNYIYLLEGSDGRNAPYKDMEQVIYHYTIPASAIDAGYKITKPGAAEHFN